MPDLNPATKSRHARSLRRVRKEMTLLADDFASSVPTEGRYSDAYFAYNFPMNMAKTMLVIKTLRSRYKGLFSGKSQYKVLDIGCGEGAGMFGLFYVLKKEADVRVLRLVGIDSSRKMLERARFLAGKFRSADSRLRVRFQKQKIDATWKLQSRKKYDMIIFANSLVEIIGDDSIPSSFMGMVFGRLADQGLVVIIEPALKRYARRLMNLRDGLRCRRDIQVLLPCFHDGPCAILELEKRHEWCHQSVAWSPPEFMKIINEGLNREIDILKFSYLVLFKDKSRRERPQGYRVVSQLLKEKGKSRCFICTPQGRVELIRLSKSKTARNACFDLLSKGVVLELRNVNAKKNNYWQVMEETDVKIVL